jgi:hypothetical protein
LHLALLKHAEVEARAVVRDQQGESGGRSGGVRRVSR